MAEHDKRIVVVSGLSGAGKSVALHALEDSGYYCIDNLPIGLLAEFYRQIRELDQPLYREVAIGIDARNPADDLSRLPDILKQWRCNDTLPELVFIEAKDQVLIKRFSETRRRHPLSSNELPLEEAIKLERKLLGPLSEEAMLCIDTSHMHVHQLRNFVRERVAQRQSRKLSLQIISFGYKHGIPLNADFVFDLRCLPNPHWDPNLRDFTGRDKAVSDFLEGAPVVNEMATHLESFLRCWIPRFESEDRIYLTIAVGCTGGRHRSVYMAERLARVFRNEGTGAMLSHRDMS